MKSLRQFTAFFCLITLLGVIQAQAGFTSFYIFGDSVSSTTNGPGDQFYYSVNGQRWSNGRVWVEVLAQRQSLVVESNKNWSFYGHNSSNLLANLSVFNTPTNASNSLFIVWINNADFVDHMTYIYPSLNLAAWSNAIQLSLTNHFKIVTNLYSKGARTLIMPNAVDITQIPQFNSIVSPAEKNFIRERTVEFNTSLKTMASNQTVNFPALKIIVPDIFSLTDDVLTNSSSYGLTNALYLGKSIDAIGDPALINKSLNGPGTNYIFWDYQAPTAKFHAVIADYVQQLLSPARIANISSVGSSNQLDLADVPVGRNGVVESSTNLVNWTTAATITSTNNTQSSLVDAPGDVGFHRLRFPFLWTWP